MNFRQFLAEMPIGKFEKLGDWSPSASRRYWDKRSIGILSSEKGVEKIKKQWAKTKQTFDMWLVKTKGAWRYSEMGETTEEWVQENISQEIEVDPDNITIIYVSNVGDQKIPMTGWILAHRFGHAIRQTQEWNHFEYELHRFMSEVLKDIYNKRISWSRERTGYPYISWFGGEQNQDEILTAFAHSIGTMRTARTQKITRTYEFGYELLAQYIITGKIKFQPQLAKQLTKKGRFGLSKVLAQSSIKDAETEKEMSEYIKGVSETLEYYLENLLKSLEGKVFVM